MERLARLSRHLRPPAAGAAAGAAAEIMAEREPAIAPGTGFFPQRTSDAAEALGFLQRDGGCVFRAVPEGTELSERQQWELASALPERIFGAKLAQVKKAVRIAGGAWDGRQWRGWFTRGVDRGHIPNKPHMDGGPGDLKPDYFLMLSGECPDTANDYVGAGGDGGSILLDGYDILNSLPNREDFFTTPTECRGFAEKAAKGVGPSWRSPMAQLTERGRLMLRVPVDGHTDNGVTNPASRDLEVPVPGQEARGQAMIDAYKAAVVQADLVAPRFVVRPGEAVLIDVSAAAPFASSFVSKQRLHRITGCSTGVTPTWAGGSCGAS